MNKLYFIVLLFSFCEKLLATNPPDAISLSLGGSAAAYSSPFCIQYNAANLVYSPSNIAFNAQNRYGIRDYTKILFVGNYSLKESSLGFSYQAENGIIFNQKISAAIAKKIQPNLACGITLNLNRFSSRDSYYQNTQIITFSAGLSYQINPKNHLGFQIENPNQSEIIAFPKEKSPTTVRLGLKHQLTSNINLYIDAFQSSNQHINTCVGIEIIKDHYKIRTGYNTNQIIGCGIGIQKGSIIIDIGLSFHNHLGISPSLNTSYAW